MILDCGSYRAYLRIGGHTAFRVQEIFAMYPPKPSSLNLLNSNRGTPSHGPSQHNISYVYRTWIVKRILHVFVEYRVYSIRADV